MSHSTRVLLALTFAAITPSLAPAYTLFGERTVNRRWPEPAAVTYFINQNGTSQIPFVDLRPVIVASMQTWTDVEDSNLTFVDGGNTAAGFSIGDNQNTIVFIDSGFPFSSGIVAFTQSAFHASGENLDLTRTADIVLNSQHHQFTLDGSVVGSFDVMSAITHEAGHVVGLDHSSVRGSTMYWEFTRVGAGGASGLQVRTLSADDIAGAQDLYGSGVGTGSLGGTVFSDIGGQGMMVGAVNMATGETITAVCGGRAGIPNDTWEMHRLEPGTYVVFTFPLDDVGFGMLPLDLDNSVTNVDNVFQPRFYREGAFVGVGTLEEATRLEVVAGAMVDGLLIIPPQTVVSQNLYYTSRVSNSIGRGAALMTHPTQAIFYGYSVTANTVQLLGPPENTMTGSLLLGSWASPTGIGGETVGRWGSTATVTKCRTGALMTLFVEHSGGEVDFLPGSVEIGFEIPEDAGTDDLWWIN